MEGIISMVRKQIILVLFSIIGLFMTSCSLLVPEAKLPQNDPQVIVNEASMKRGIRLEAINSDIIYLYIETATNQSFGNDSSLSNNFSMMAQTAAASFGSRVKVVTNAAHAKKILNDPSTRDNIYSVNIAISDYNLNAESSSSGIDFGLEFGKGNGETMADGNPYSNIDKISRIRLEMTFDAKGFIVAKRSATIGISEVNRGYYIGMRVNGSGFGISASTNKRQGIGNAVSRLLHFMYGDILEEIVVGKKSKNRIKRNYTNQNNYHINDSTKREASSDHYKSNTTRSYNGTDNDNSELDELLEGI